MHTVQEFANMKGLSTVDIARETGYTRQAIWQHFTGKIKDHRNLVNALIVAYGEDARHFFSDTVSVDTDKSEAHR